MKKNDSSLTKRIAQKSPKGFVAMPLTIGRVEKRKLNAAMPRTSLQTKGLVFLRFQVSAFLSSFFLVFSSLIIHTSSRSALDAKERKEFREQVRD